MTSFVQQSSSSSLLSSHSPPLSLSLFKQKQHYYRYYHHHHHHQHLNPNQNNQQRTSVQQQQRRLLSSSLAALSLLFYIFDITMAASASASSLSLTRGRGKHLHDVPFFKTFKLGFISTKPKLSSLEPCPQQYYMQQQRRSRRMFSISTAPTILNTNTNTNTNTNNNVLQIKSNQFQSLSFQFFSSARLCSTDTNDPPPSSTLHDLSEEDIRSLLLPQQKDEQQQQQPPTVKNILNNSIHIFTNHSIPEPLHSSVHLLSSALNLPWDSGFLHLLHIYEQQTTRNNENDDEYLQSLQNQILAKEEINNFLKLMFQRFNLEPIQYILGQWDFYDFTLQIRKPLLCPRPETEELVEYVRCEILQLQKKRKRIRILDVGCGTGAIGIALVKLYPTNVDVVAIDVLKEAVELSSENARKILGDFALVLEGDEKVEQDKEEEERSTYRVTQCSAQDFTNTNRITTTTQKKKYTFDFDIVVSNPPYIPSVDMKTLTQDVVNYEDYNALCGGEDGLNVIRDIVHRLSEWCCCCCCCFDNDKYHDGEEEEEKECLCWMEVDTSHPKLMKEWLSPALSSQGGGARVEFVSGQKDLSGLDRFVKLRVISPPKKENMIE